MNTLLFVYNADGGLFNLVKDWAHKIISPETYPCSLCALTYDNLGMRSSWQEFTNELKYEINFLHRDELEEHYDISDVALPAIFVNKEGKPKLWLNSEAMDASQSLDELQMLVIRRLTQKA